MPSPTPVDYTARAYDDLKASMLARIPAHLPEWRNRSEGDFGVVLIELFAYMGDMLSFYIDRAVNESSLQTAVLRETVLSYANLLGYVPHDMIPATGSVIFTAAPGRVADTVIPAGTVIQTYTPSSDSASLAFTTDEEITIAAADISGTVGVTQGTITYGELIVAAGGAVGASFEASLFQLNVVLQSVVLDVIIDGVSTRWNRVDSLLSAGPSDQVYTVRIDANGVTYVRFGDGANGLIPPAAAEIKATYRTAVGEGGNVAANVVTVIPAMLEGVVSVTNPVAITGGMDRESIDSIRSSLPNSIRAVNRAVSIEDFEPLAKQVVGVRHAKADADVYTSVNLYVVPTAGGVPSDDLVARLEEWFAPRTLIGTDVTVLDPTYVGVNITLDLYVLPTYFAEETAERVRAALNNLLSLPNVDLGMVVNLSTVYRTILDQAGVDYADVTLLARADGTQSGTGPQTFNIDEVPIPGVVTLNVTGGI